MEWLFNPTGNKDIESSYTPSTVIATFGVGISMLTSACERFLVDTLSSGAINDDSKERLQSYIADAYGYPIRSLGGTIIDDVYHSSCNDDPPLFPVVSTLLLNGVSVSFFEYDIVAIVYPDCSQFTFRMT